MELTREELSAMSEEECKDALLESLSRAVISAAHKLAMLKAVAHVENGVAPEDFDKAFNEEYGREWLKVEDKNGVQLAAIAMMDMIADGADPAEIFGFMEEE